MLRCIVLHCNAGLSRSPGVAAALSNVLCGNDQSFFERYRPNRRVYTLLLDVFANEFSLTDA
jgi:protein-tyrosine phosphatase